MIRLAGMQITFSVFMESPNNRWEKSVLAKCMAEVPLITIRPFTPLLLMNFTLFPDRLTRWRELHSSMAE
jgi:hypothetical protein